MDQSQRWYAIDKLPIIQLFPMAHTVNSRYIEAGYNEIPAYSEM